MKMLNLMLALGVFSLWSLAPAFAQVNSDAVLGEWFNEEKDAKVDIYKEGDKYFGKVVWLLEPFEDDGVTPKLDDNNPDPELAAKPVMGIILLKEFEFNGKQWRDGKIYDPKNGKTYNCFIEQLEPEKLKIRGYIGKSWMGLGRTTYWTR